MRLSCALLAFFALAGPVAVSAGDWTRFRGPNGTGAVTGEDVPAEIGEKQNRLWKVRLPGPGNSSPVVASGKIFLQAASEDGNERQLLCLDLKDGRLLWSRKTPGTTATTHAKNTLASGTAALDDGRVFITFWNGSELALAAYDFDGKPLWSTDLGPFSAQHGAGHSPIVVNGRVILVNDQDGAAEIVALSARTGKVEWRTPRPPFKASYSTPFVLDVAGEAPQVVVASTAGTAGYDSESGSEQWKFDWTTNNLKLRTVGSPIAAQGMVFFTAGNGPGDRHAVAVRLDGRGDLDQSHLAWETRKTLPYVPCLLARGEHLYFVNDAGIAGCYMARTGERVWEERLGIGNVTASPVMIDGRVFVVSETGKTATFAAELVFRRLGAGELEEGVRASPAVADGRLLVRGQAHLYCFGQAERSR